MSHISAACSAACTRIETDASKAGGTGSGGDCCFNASAVHPRLQQILWALPASVLESLVPLVLRCQTAAIAKNRSHKGLVTALQCLLGPNLKRLDIGALFHGCRLYGDVNSRCTILMSISNLTF